MLHGASTGRRLSARYCSGFAWHLRLQCADTAFATLHNYTSNASLRRRREPIFTAAGGDNIKAKSHHCWAPLLKGEEFVTERVAGP